MRRWIQRHPEEHKKRGREGEKKIRDAALAAIAYFRGIAGNNLVCMWWLTPDLPTMREPCNGRLELDHINGGGTEDFEKNGRKVYLKIRDGKRNLVEYRILCRFHNHWNFTAGVSR